MEKPNKICKNDGQSQATGKMEKSKAKDKRKTSQEVQERWESGIRKEDREGASKIGKMYLGYAGITNP